MSKESDELETAEMLDASHDLLNLFQRFSATVMIQMARHFQVWCSQSQMGMCYSIFSGWRD